MYLANGLCSLHEYLEFVVPVYNKFLFPPRDLKHLHFACYRNSVFFLFSFPLHQQLFIIDHYIFGIICESVLDIYEYTGLIYYLYIKGVAGKQTIFKFISLWVGLWLSLYFYFYFIANSSLGFIGLHNLLRPI